MSIFQTFNRNTTTNKKTISIIIPIKDADEIINPICDREDIIYEIIIVDNSLKSLNVQWHETNNIIVKYFHKPEHTNRAQNMNYGYDKSSGEYIIFLHNDTCLPVNYVQDIINCDYTKYDFGCFKLSFNSFNIIFYIIAFFANNIRRFPYGDQCYFMHRTKFLRFDELPILEDYEYTIGKCIYKSNKKITTSHIRYGNNILSALYRSIYNILILLCYIAKYDVYEIAKKYYNRNTLNTMVLVCKNPTSHLSKTRLRKELPYNLVNQISIKLFKNAYNILRQHNDKKILYHRFFNDLTNIDKNVQKVQQPNKSFDKILNDIYKTEVLINNNRIVIVGSDCYQLEYNIITKAFNELDKYDIVIGPDINGGFYLFAAKRYYSFIFNIKLSTKNTFNDIIQALLSSNITYLILEYKSDLNYKEDLDKNIGLLLD